jgi:hypothetical protein
MEKGAILLKTNKDCKSFLLNKCNNSWKLSQYLVLRKDVSADSQNALHTSAKNGNSGLRDFNERKSEKSRQTKSYSPYNKFNMSLKRILVG